LEALARASGKISLAELSARTGLHLSTCHHLVATIAARGYITQDRDTRHYSLGSKIFELSEARTRQIDLVALATPHLNRLNRETGEAVHLAVIEGTDLVTVARLNSLYAVRVDNAISKSNAAHATATGKAILAWLPESEIDEILASKGMERFTPNTIVQRDALIEELRLVRRYGYSEDREEFQPGVYSVGGAIRSHKGMVVGSICLSLPTMRAMEDAVAKARRAVKSVALTMSKELGSSVAP
jgi:IclR family acetate operon transcriptional repressor